MGLVTLKVPPGQNNGGTDSKSAGSYRMSLFVRGTSAGDLKPWGGFVLRSQDPVTGIARAVLIWADNDGIRRIAVGTNSGLFVYTLDGAVTDITPDPFSVGGADTEVNTGYGGGNYGSGDYGTPRPLDEEPIDASVWSLASYGEYLVGVCFPDGNVYEWPLTGLPEPIPNAPTLSRCLVVTPARQLMVGGANGNPRLVAYSTNEDNQVWTPDANNQAGDQELPTSGKIMCAAVLGNDVLWLTDVDAHLAVYTGDDFVFEWRKLGEGMGAISQGCLVGAETRAYWWAPGGMWSFEGGFLTPIPCAVWDEIDELNEGQRAKVVGWLKSDENEVVWTWPSEGSTECDRYVTFNYLTGAWWTGAWTFTCGSDREGLEQPIAITVEGDWYDQEQGFEFMGAQPFARTGPIKLGEGEYVTGLGQWLPDQRTLGEATLQIYGKDRQMDEFVADPDGPYAAIRQVDLRMEARIFELEYAFLDDGRIGEPQIEVLRRGKR